MWPKRNTRLKYWTLKIPRGTRWYDAKLYIHFIYIKMIEKGRKLQWKDPWFHPILKHICSMGLESAGSLPKVFPKIMITKRSMSHTSNAKADKSILNWRQDQIRNKKTIQRNQTFPKWHGKFTPKVDTQGIFGKCGVFWEIFQSLHLGGGRFTKIQHIPSCPAYDIYCTIFKPIRRVKWGLKDFPLLACMT